MTQPLINWKAHGAPPYLFSSRSITSSVHTKKSELLDCGTRAILISKQTNAMNHIH